MADGGERPHAEVRLRELLPDALGELARGVDRADVRASGTLLGSRGTLAPRPLLAGLTTLLMRLVVRAHLEARALAPAGETLAAIHAELTARGTPASRRARASEHTGASARVARPARMEARRKVGASRVARGSTDAWPRVLATLDVLHTTLGGALFDPQRFPFLAGPLDDACALGVLDRLLGHGIAWAELDVEDVVGAYEDLVGFELRVAHAETVVVLPQHAAIDLASLARVPPKERGAWVVERAGGSAGMRLADALARAGSIDALAAALARRASPRWPARVPAGSLYVAPGEARRRAGAHYTPRALTGPLVDRTLGPLFARAGSDPARILDLRICDPAMGTGAFLVEACRRLADRLREVDPTLDTQSARLAAARCLRGVDADPLAVDLARVALWLTVGAPTLRLDFADAHLRAGDALVGAGASAGPIRAEAEALEKSFELKPFHWLDAFAEVLSPPRNGFDAFVGNPPWVAYAGRAAQPLPDELFDFYLRHYPSFFGYRTLHGLFIHRAASLLAPGGRLGLVVPTSVSDLGGYEPTRRAHDALCVIDDELPDFGDAFVGVFQPSMGLLSTRRAEPAAPSGKSAPWRVARDDVDEIARGLLARLAALPPLPPECFGERGFQTTGDDVKKLRPTPHAMPPFVVPIREGGDVRAFQALPPRLHLDPRDLTGRLRAPDSWREVRVLVRQTARFPIAARADGIAFRNSVLACFAAGPYGEDALLAYLNAGPIRWLHFMRHRDARQGMPQVKVAHLRSIPRLPEDAPRHLAALADLGATLGRRNDGITPDEQRALDDLVAAAFALTNDERALVTAWAAQHPAP
ncbi:Type II restriction enzyme, methylase subunit [Minicystis rosea]|nr:Type II restriction enzyme, methylase subunit [Minicystis rosea]